MQKINVSIEINAPREKVWHVMLDDKTYREWTSAFCPGSHYRGSLEKGSKIVFVGPDPETGKEMGMVSEVAENKEFEYFSIHHIGMFKDGVEDYTSEEVKKWAPAYENYSFSQVGDKATVTVDQDIQDEYKEEFTKMWLVALDKLKHMCEA